MLRTFLSLIFCLLISIVSAQSKSSIDFESYNPPSSLVVPQHVVTKAKYPFIDIHNHQNNMSPEALKGLVQIMDTLNMAVMNNLSGSWGDNLKKSVSNIRSTAPKRFTVFANINFNGMGAKDWTEKAV